MKKTIIFLVGCAILLGIVAWLYQRRIPITIGTSDWPAWDMFQHAQSTSSITHKYVPQFKYFPNYPDLITAFINGDVPIATVTVFEAIHAYHQLNGAVRIILLLDYSTGGGHYQSKKYLIFGSTKGYAGGNRTPYDISLYVIARPKKSQLSPQPYYIIPRQIKCPDP